MSKMILAEAQATPGAMQHADQGNDNGSRLLQLAQHFHADADETGSRRPEAARGKFGPSSPMHISSCRECCAIHDTLANGV